MNDADILGLARRAGIAVEWRDYANRRHQVSLDSVRRILSALDLPCDTDGEAKASREKLEHAALPPLLTVTAGQALEVPFPRPAASRRGRIIREDGTVADLELASPDQARVPPIETPGYHTIELGEQRLGVAVAPGRCFTISDIAPDERLWALAAQVYGLRSDGDCGIGDMSAVAALAAGAASLRADALALSPTHALFSSDPRQISPYSPSNRTFYNPLHADASVMFDAERLRRAKAEAGCGTLAERLEASPEIDWVQSSRLKLMIFRRLFADFAATDLKASPQTALAADFTKFCADNGERLQQHATFEVLYAARFKDDPHSACWKDWPARWRDPNSEEVGKFARAHAEDVSFHCFLQWLADRSLAHAHAAAKQTGMRIGLISDVAIGVNTCGSQCWADPQDMLNGLEIGAPPDLFNSDGQNWGLTTFSPRALALRGFAPFLATIRSCMRHAGGVRIDHAMGMMRLWVIPQGAQPSEGAYLSYPLDDLLRLLALESHRHSAIVVGEDLGTVPEGFRQRLELAGIYGMRVLWFERDRSGFTPPSAWPAAAVAMTSTHDLPTVAGWWSGRDIKVRAQAGRVPDLDSERGARRGDRRALWRAFQVARVADTEQPPADQGDRVADAAVKFIAATPSRLALLPLEDALALKEQPNLPGTITEHPNWRRRYPKRAGDLLAVPQVRNRCTVLAGRKTR